jgi:hypothetical protein
VPEADRATEWPKKSPCIPWGRSDRRSGTRCRRVACTRTPPRRSGSARRRWAIRRPRPRWWCPRRPSRPRSREGRRRSARPHCDQPPAGRYGAGCPPHAAASPSTARHPASELRIRLAMATPPVIPTRAADQAHRRRSWWPPPGIGPLSMHWSLRCWRTGRCALSLTSKRGPGLRSRS